MEWAMQRQQHGGWAPVDHITVRVRPEAPGKPHAVRLATIETDLPYRQDGDWVVVTVPRLHDHEIVVFELARDEHT